MARQRTNDILAIVRAVYQELTGRPVARNCRERTECCQFQLTGRTPHLTKGEALLAAKAFRATGRRELADAADGICPLLNRLTGRCLIYVDRPFACRTHFCAAAGGPYSRHEVIDLIRRLEDLDVLLQGDGPRKLFPAVSAALDELR